jgi:hypothetical protein
MAFVTKNVPKNRVGQPVLAQLIQVSRPAATITQNTATEMLFRVRGGRVLVHRMIAEVTTAIQNQACTLTLSSKKLDSAGAAVGTAVDIAAASTVTNKELGSTVTVLGSGAAAIVNNAGAGISTLGTMPFMLPQGEVYATASANNTGALKYDIWYQPLDPGSFIEPSAALTAVI